MKKNDVTLYIGGEIPLSNEEAIEYLQKELVQEHQYSMRLEKENKKLHSTLEKLRTIIDTILNKDDLPF